jgi:hypothetical protein
MAAFYYDRAGRGLGGATLATLNKRTKLGLVAFAADGPMPIDADTISAVFGPIAPDGKFVGEPLAVLRALGRRRKVALLAFPPKAAGTFLRTAIACAADAAFVRTVHAQGGRDAVPYLPYFVNYFTDEFPNESFVAHMHMLALPANLNFLQAFAIRPIVIKRNIPDMLASYWDMLDSDEEARKDGLNCHIPLNFPELPAEAKADFMIDVVGPWYVNYYAGWLDYAARRPDGLLVLDYQDLHDEPETVLQTVVAHMGCPRTLEDCMIASSYVWKNRGEYRYNKGELGRGRKYFTPAHVDRLALLMRHYPILEAYKGELLGAA